MAPNPPKSVRLERTLPASTHAVYRAWLDPEMVGRWMAPGGRTVDKVEIDERPGGAYRTWQSEGGTIVGGFDSKIERLEPDRRLDLAWGFVGPDGRAGPSFDTLLSIELRPLGPHQASLVLTHDDLDELGRAMPEVACNVAAGWDDAIDKLAALLAVGSG
jgi:uncharacterized protein YndB with AHSA1/START domain